MSYYVLGRLFVERFPADDGEDIGDYEILESTATSDAPMSEPETDITDIVFDDADVPKEPGVYALMYVAVLNYRQDYFGEWDVDVEVEWLRVTQLTDEEKKAIVVDVLDVAEPEESFEDLLIQTGQLTIKER